VTIRTIVKSSIAAAMLAVLPVSAGAAVDLPCQAVKLIVPWKPGGGTDIIFREVALEAQKHLGKDIVIQNISGQSGSKGAKVAKDARPDGCTIFAGHDSLQTTYVTGKTDFNYFAYEPIVLLTFTPAIVGASGKVDWNNMAEMVAYAKAHPGEVLIGATLNSTSHFLAAAVEDAAGIKLKIVSYEGTAERKTAMMGGHVQLGELNITAAQKLFKTGDLKGLGIATEQRDPRLPDLPTLKEQGYDIVTGISRGVFAPKGTPQDILDMYEAAFAKSMQNPELTKSLEGKGTVPTFKSRADFVPFLTKSAEEIEGLAKKIGIFKGKKAS
jgi:tripartite-type tricarboxylate transporter receptor subunit TctC